MKADSALITGAGFGVLATEAVVAKAVRGPRPHSWGHAVIDWPDGARREGWLRADDGMDYTADAVMAAVMRLAEGDRPAGAYTPAAAFGPEIGTAAGGTFILD